MKDLLDRTSEPRPIMDLYAYLKSKENVADLAKVWISFYDRESVNSGYSFVLRTQNQMKLCLAFVAGSEKLPFIEAKQTNSRY